MKKTILSTIIFTFVALVSFLPAAAQFPIKLPKLPKIEKPKPESPKTDDNTSNQTTMNDSSRVQSKQSDQADPIPKKLNPPPPPSVPLLLIDTLEISLKQQNQYWKVPNQRYYSNWHPQVKFNIFYNNNERVRYTAEWFKPDGSLWFNESLEVYETTDIYENPDGDALRSPYNGDLFDKLSTDQIGTYGLKITDNKTKAIVFQGKFNVKKSIDTPGDAQMKNAFQFFVDNDWHLAVGYAGFRKSQWGATGLQPEIMLWFKDVPDRKNLEARLFYNNQEIASTDDGGVITDEAKRGDECARGQEICRYALMLFRWDRFKVKTPGYTQERYPDTVFTNDKPGEYTIKVFYKGAQVREAKFTIGADGMVARNGFSNNVYPSLTLIPVKVIGTAEKWNPNSWKTGMFYGNPIAGFTVQ
jgi:hypothetical protein